MDLISFYKAVLPPEGPYALFTPNPKPGKHVWADTISELVAKTESRADVPDWYFATGSYFDRKRKQANCIGKKCFYLDVDASEEKFAKNPKTAYRTIQDAVAALVEFVRVTGLNPSIVILSGGGLHAYYVLDEVMNPTAWLDVAERLKVATKAAGFKADPTSTCDSARILRAPGTTHWSGNKVRVLQATGQEFTPQQMREGIAKVPIPADVPAAAGAPLMDLSDFDAAIEAAGGAVYAEEVNDDFGAKFENLPTSAVKIAQRCAALREIAENQQTAQEPQWRAMLGIVKHTVEGAEQAHAWSKDHDEYDYLSTQEKFERYAAGPPLCETFSMYTDKCVGCEHRGKIKSPIVLGRVSVEDESKADMAAVVEAVKAQENNAPPPPAIAEIPADVLGPNYRVHPSSTGAMTMLGKVEKLKKEENGETVKVTVWVPFTQDVFWLTGWTEAGRHDHENSSLALVLYRRKKYQAFDLPNETTADRKALLKFLNSKTINPLNYEPETLAMMQQYVNEQIRRVKEAAAKPVVRDHLGFHMDSAGELYCAHGEYIIYKDGTIRKAILGHSLETIRYAMMIEGLPPTNQNHWDPSVWTVIKAGAARQQHFFKEWWGKPGLEVAQLAIMLQMASPLLVFAAPSDMVPLNPLPAIGLTVSLFSTESAKGKTSIQTASTYAFGDPAALIRQGDRLGMTFNAQIAMAAALGTFPFPMDEVTTNDAQQVGESINRIASGIEKLRASKDGSMARAPVSWALVSTVSTNVPQRELVGEFQKGSDALQMRLIELNCDTLPTRSSGVVPEYDAALRAAMHDTKGTLGALIHLYCCMVGYDRMRKKTLDKLKYVTDKSPGESKERFILRGIAAMLVLADILEELRLTFFDPKVLESEAIKALVGARDYSITQNKEAATPFLNMMRDLAPHILVTATDISAEMTPVENERSVRTPLVGRLCRDVNALYLSGDAVRQWAVDHGMSPSGIMSEARNAGYLMEFSPGVVFTSTTISKGIRGHWAPRMNCWKINASRLRTVDDSHSADIVPLHRVAVEQQVVNKDEVAK